MENFDLKEALQWRYATKRMNKNRISDIDFSKIIESIKQAPSSRGLQPFKVIIVERPEIKEKILPIADNQPQVIESSHLLVFAAWSGVTAQQIDDFILYAATERGIPVERLEKMKSMLVKDQLLMDEEQFYQWASKQIYLALGFALTASAIYKIDACPMEGFNNKALDEFLDLKTQGLQSVVLLALGYRDPENDWLLKLKKVRRRSNDLFVTIESL